MQIILIAYMVLLFSGLLSLSLYWLFEISYYGAIFEFGILVFLVMIIADTVISLVGKVRYRTEMQAYERLMKEDWMTGMQSREPFENLLAEIPKTMNEHKDILLVFMYDQLGRNLNETPFIAEWFTKKGIHVWSVYEGEIIDAVDAERMLDYIRFWQTDEAQKL